MRKHEDTGLIKGTLIVGLIVLMSAMVLLLASCSTVNGAFRDIKSLSEAGISVSQKGADKQMGDSIAWAIKDQNRIMNNGQQVARGLRK